MTVPPTAVSRRLTSRNAVGCSFLPGSRRADLAECSSQVMEDELTIRDPVSTVVAWARSMPAGVLVSMPVSMYGLAMNVALALAYFLRMSVP